MKKTYTVFISSTSRDLIPYRRAVTDGCLDAGYHPIDMYNFMAHTEDAVSVSLKEVEEADLFVGIYAWRYGYVPEEADCSIIEMEFRSATELGKPRFCFFIDETYPWPDEFRENGFARRLLADFKARIDKTQIRTTFTTPEDLKAKMLASLIRWEREQHERQSQIDVARSRLAVMKLFISYAHVDEYCVRELVDILRDANYDPWFDQHLMAGSTWKAQLLEAIEWCDCFLYALTPESVASQWCQWEFAQAVNAGKPVIPVMIQSMPLDGVLSRIQYADFSQGPTPRAVAKLLGGVQNARIISPIEVPLLPEPHTNPERPFT